MDDTSEADLEATMTLDPETDPEEVSLPAEDAEGLADDQDGDVPEGSPGEALENAAPKRLGRGAKLSDKDLEKRVFALVFASPEPLSLAKLVPLLENPQPDRVQQALERLEARFKRAGLPLQVLGLRGGFTLATTDEMADVVARLAKGNSVEKVSPAALETLAVIAYRQPVTKAEIEAIRGVQAGPIMRALVDRGLARVVGRADQPGHPLQYGTTKEFLDRFGLMNLKELPRDTELARD
ncbi:MAG: SMC-Scp complex subunit ScpB [bacterium]|nr:SMC-Scp complex subunit ScpB [bacterium]